MRSRNGRSLSLRISRRSTSLPGTGVPVTSEPKRTTSSNSGSRSTSACTYSCSARWTASLSKYVTLTVLNHSLRRCDRPLRVGPGVEVHRRPFRVRVRIPGRDVVLVQLLGRLDELVGRSGDRRKLPEKPAHRVTAGRSEEHTSELQSLAYLVCRLLLEKKKTTTHVTSRNNKLL